MILGFDVGNTHIVMGIIEKVYEIMDQMNCEAILISNRHSMRYITGYCGDTGIAVITKK